MSGRIVNIEIRLGERAIGIKERDRREENRKVERERDIWEN